MVMSSIIYFNLKHFHCKVGIWHWHPLFFHFQLSGLSSRGSHVIPAVTPRPIRRVARADSMTTDERISQTVSVYSRVTHRYSAHMVIYLVEPVNACWIGDVKGLSVLRHSLSLYFLVNAMWDSMSTAEQLFNLRYL